MLELFILGIRNRRFILGATSKVVSPVMRAVGQAVRGSPGPVRPLRLMPLRTRRFADQHNRYDSNSSTSETSQDTDQSSKVGDQGYNSGNINNQVGNGPATAGDFNNGLAPITFVSVSTTIHPTSRRPNFHRRQPSFYNYDDNYYYDDYVAPRPTRPARRHSHRPRVRPTTTTATTTTTQNPKTQLLKELIKEGILDPKDLFDSDMFTHSYDHVDQTVQNSTEPTFSRQRRSDPGPSETEFFQYAQYVSVQQTSFWNEINPIISKYQVDFNILVSIQTDPVDGGDITPQTLYAVQTSPPNFDIKNRKRRSAETKPSSEPESDPSEISVETFDPSITEVRNITHIFHKETTHTVSFESTYQVSFRTVLYCVAIVVLLIVFYCFRHTFNFQ